MAGVTHRVAELVEVLHKKHPQASGRALEAGDSEIKPKVETVTDKNTAFLLEKVSYGIPGSKYSLVKELNLQIR